MNIQQPKIDLKNNFSVYLEGIPVDFSNVNISEKEGGIPAASISFASNYGAMRVLPGTIVQVFGYMHAEDTEYLLFEGEVTAINYQRSESAKVIVLKAISLLGGMVSAKYLPSDRLISQDFKDATGIQESKAIIYNEKNQDSSVTPTQINEVKNLKNSEPTFIKDRVKDLTISSLYNLTDEFQRYLASDKPGGKGDFYPMIREFSKIFEYNDIYYGLRALTYKFARSMFVAPNPDLLNKIKIDVFMEALNQARSSGMDTVYSENPFSLMQILIEFQRHLHYDFISPAAYTACRPFYVQGNKTWEPLRMAYVPKLEIGPPALCNVFFPEQVSTYTYSREMMNEPTRIIGKATSSLIPKQKIDLSTCVLYPEMDVVDGKAAANFSLEESYRGINYKTIEYKNLISDVFRSKKTKTGNGKVTTKDSDITKKDMKGDIGNIIKTFAYADYINMRYQGRQTSVSAEWSPYRMVGLPALILEEEGVSIVGVVSSLETNISANGVATSRATIRNCKLIYDNEFEKTVFSKVPADNIDSFEKYVIHDLTNDGIMASNPLLFYNNLYSFETIGMDIYTYITNGMLSANEGLYNLISEKGILDYAENRLNPENYEIPIHPRIDNSILHFIRSSVYDAAFKVEIPEVYNTKTEVRNTYLLYKAIVALKDMYKTKKYVKRGDEQMYDMQQAYAFAHSVNRRNIITKEDYFNFIGAKINRESLDEDAYDGYYILNEGVDELRSTIEDMIDVQFDQVIDNTEARKLKLQKRIAKLNTEITELNRWITELSRNATLHKDEINKQNIILDEKTSTLEQYEEELTQLDTQTTITTEKDFDTEIYKPYNMNRRMHVVLALKDYINVTVDNSKTKIKVTK